MNMQDEKYQQKSKYISSAEPNYFVHFAMRYPVIVIKKHFLSLFVLLYLLDFSDITD